MLKQKTSSLLVMLMIMLQLLYAVGYSPQAANAAAIPINLIDSVSMAVYDKAGHVVTEDVYEQGSKVQLDYTWSLPEGHGYRNGDTFTFKLPEAFKFYNDILEQPLLSNGGAIGKFTVYKDTREVVMTLETIENVSDVKGTLTFQTLFDTKIIQGSTTQVIKIPVRGGEQIFTLNFKPDAASPISKSGAPNGFNAKSIDWTVDVNKELSVVHNAVVTDPIPAGLSAPVSVAVYELGMHLDGTAVQGAQVDSSKYTLSTTGGLLKLSFTDSPIRTAYRIQYTTPVTDADKASFANKASFEGSDRSPVSASATVNVQRGAALDKSSTKYDSSTQTIDWEIKYNYNEKTITQADAFVTDLFDDAQELVANSIHVYPVTLDSSGTETLGAELDSAEYTLTPELASGQAGFKLQFLHDITSAYKIQYQTKAVSRVTDYVMIINKAVSGSGDSKTAFRNIDQVIMTKKVGVIDYAAKTAAWSIAINQDRQPMSSVVITDTFTNQGLHLIPGSIVVNEESGPMNPSDYVIDSTIPVEQGFKITFNKALTGSVTISYKTDFNMDWLSGGATNFMNTAVMDWIDADAHAQTKSVSETFNPRNEVKNNGFKNGSYDASLKQITWSIGVNYNGRTLAGAVVEDLLESGQRLVDPSLSVYNMIIPANGNPSQGTVVDSTYYSYTVGSDNKLVVTFLQPITAPYYISFKTSLEGRLIGEQVSNTAILLDGGTPVSQPLTASVSIPNGGEYVNKNGRQNGDKVEWTVLINRGQSTLADAQITDTPSENQLLLPDTFKLYTAKAAANGTVSKDAELIKDTDYTLQINTDGDGKQSFVLSFLKQLSTAAALEYQSFIVANDQETLSNKVGFSGNNEVTVTKDTTKSIVVGVTSGSGTISGVRGSLTVTKTDSADSSVRLGGAVFELYRQAGSDRLLIGTLTTDASGTAVFNALPAGNYVVQEKAAPTGYVLNAKEYPVTIQTTAGFQLTVANDKIVTPDPPTPPSPVEGPLTVTKVDSAQAGLLLEGATFELYMKTGTDLTLVAAKITDGSGTAVFHALPAGDYVVKETAAPAGYVLNAKEYPVTIQTAAGFQLTVANDKIITPDPPTPPSPVEGPLTITKVDSAQAGLLLGGAAFELYKKTGTDLTLIAAKTTDASGTAVFDALPAGSYIVKETAAPAGYVLDTKEYPVTIETAAGAELTVTNRKRSNSSSSSSSSSSSETPSETPTPTPAGSPPAGQDHPIEGNIQVPLGAPPDVNKHPNNGDGGSIPASPESEGKDRVVPDDATDDGGSPEEIIDVNGRRVPLGSPPNQEAAGNGETLPKTGEASPAAMEISGLFLVLLGIILQRKFTKKA